MLTSSTQSIMEGDSHKNNSKDTIDSSTTKDTADQQSAKTAKNLARLFSLEDKLKQQLSFSQDEFKHKIAQLLIEVGITRPQF